MGLEIGSRGQLEVSSSCSKVYIMDFRGLLNSKKNTLNTCIGMIVLVWFTAAIGQFPNLGGLKSYIL